MYMIAPGTLSLISTNVAASARNEWASGTTYAVGDEVKDTRTFPNKLYKSITSSNIGNDPATDRVNWFDEGATNQHKMFDSAVSSQTENADSIVVEIDITRADFFSIFRLDATSLRLEVTEGVTVLYDNTWDLETSSVTDLFEYFFADFEFTQDVATTIPISYSATAKITITKTGSIAKCGHVVFGRRKDIGLSEWGAQVGEIDFSRKITDDLGQTVLSKGSYAETIELTGHIRTTRLDDIKRYFASVRATPIVLEANNGDTSYEAFLIFGFIKEFKFKTDVIGTNYSLEFQGLT